MKHLWCTLFLGYLWQACRCTQQVRFMTVINASSIGDAASNLSLATLEQPSIFLSPLESLRQWSPEAVSEMLQRLLPLSLGVMNGQSALLSMGMSRLLTVSFLFLLLFALGFLLYLSDVSMSDDSAMLAAENSNGPWAQAYKGAEGARRDAIELIFSCKIVTAEEVSSDDVERERIDEFCWVAGNMLFQRTLGDWAQNPEHAQKTFELCFKASFPDSANKTEQEWGRALKLEEKTSKSEQGSVQERSPPQRESPHETGYHPQAGDTGGSVQSAPSVTDDTWQSSTCGSTLLTDRSLGDLEPGGSLRLLDDLNPLAPDASSSGAGSRALPLHLLGPTPTIFKQLSGRGKEPGLGSDRRWRSPGTDAQSAQSSGRGAASAVLSGRAHSGRMKYREFSPKAPGVQTIQEDKSPQVPIVEPQVPVLDCSPRTLASADTELPEGIVPQGDVGVLSRTPESSNRQTLRDVAATGEANPAG